MPVAFTCNRCSQSYQPAMTKRTLDGNTVLMSAWGGVLCPPCVVIIATTGTDPAEVAN